jgi:U3 small nucleolar RNA-associated protein 10
VLIVSRHLSSRLIPHAQSTINTLLTAAQSGSAIAFQAFTTISAVIEAIPTFVSSKQLIAVLQAAIEQREEIETSGKLLNVVSKKVPTKTLFPVVMDLWKELQAGNASVSQSAQ